jgi:4-hydroxy-3-polyprenylbenzoate decarboxylase
VGITGSEDLEYGVRLLEVLQTLPVESHLVIDSVASAALGPDEASVRELSDQVYGQANQAARISSGSFLTRGMVVVPCSTSSLGAIVIGLADNLVHRAADVTLKDGRPLVLGLTCRSLSPIDEENVGRASGVPGLTVRQLDESVDEAVASLIDQLGLFSDSRPA